MVQIMLRRIRKNTNFGGGVFMPLAVAPQYVINISFLIEDF